MAVTQTTVPSIHSSSASQLSKHVAIRPKAQLSRDMDEETMTPEPDIMGDGIERDEETEEIVRELEKGLPRWPGFGEEGWLDGLSQVRLVVDSFHNQVANSCRNISSRSFTLSKRIKMSCELIYSRVTSVGNQNMAYSGNRLATALEAVSEESTIPYLSYTVSSVTLSWS